MTKKKTTPYTARAVMDPDTHRLLKMLAAKRGETMHEIIARLVQQAAKRENVG